MTAETEEDPAATVRRSARSVPRAALDTLLRNTSGAPYVSLVKEARTARLAFQQSVLDPESAGGELVRLARLARSRLPTASQ